MCVTAALSGASHSISVSNSHAKHCDKQAWQDVVKQLRRAAHAAALLCPSQGMSLQLQNSHLCSLEQLRFEVELHCMTADAGGHVHARMHIGFIMKAHVLFLTRKHCTR